jgi:hypothetical protein
MIAGNEPKSAGLIPMEIKSGRLYLQTFLDAWMFRAGGRSFACVALA